jgi:hypothetical protein
LPSGTKRGGPAAWIGAPLEFQSKRFQTGWASPKSTIYDWRQKGIEDLSAGRDTLYSNFSDGLTRGLASVTGEMAAQIVKAGKTEWRAALAYLERAIPTGGLRSE